MKHVELTDKKLTSTTLKWLLLWPCGLTHQTDSFLALFDGTGFLVQEIGGVFGILVIEVMHR